MPIPYTNNSEYLLAWHAISRNSTTSLDFPIKSRKNAVNTLAIAVLVRHFERKQWCTEKKSGGRECERRSCFDGREVNLVV